MDLGCQVSVSLNLPVQKDEWLLAEHNEYRVAQLRQFAEHKEPGPEAAHAILLDVAVGEGWEYRSVIADLHMAISRTSRSCGQTGTGTCRCKADGEFNTNLGTQTEWKSP